MWTALASAFGALLTAIAGIAGASHRSRIGRRMRDHLELLKVAEGNDRAAAALNDLIAQEAEELRDRELKRLTRRLNPYNVGFAVVITGGGAVGMYYLIHWSAELAGAPLQWLVILLSVIVGLVAVVLALAAFATIYNPLKGSEE